MRAEPRAATQTRRNYGRGEIVRKLQVSKRDGAALGPGAVAPPLARLLGVTYGSHHLRYTDHRTIAHVPHP